MQSVNNMTYQPLTPDQFQKAQSAGFSTQQIIEMEQRRKAEQGGVSRETPKNTGLIAPRAEKILDTVFGGGKVGELFGGLAVKHGLYSDPRVGKLTPEERESVTLPSAREVAGSAARSASLFVPVGRIAQGATMGARAIGMAPKVAKAVGAIGAGAGAGYAFDVASHLEDKNVPLTAKDIYKPGVGTAVGGAIPVAGVAAKGAAALGRDVIGATTGAGGGAVRQFGKAIRAGGEKATVAREAMRGNISPQEIVDEARASLQMLVSNRSKAYQEGFSKLKTSTKVVDAKPLIKGLDDLLTGEFAVQRGSNGKLLYDRSPGLRNYEKDIEHMRQLIKGWGTQEGDNTVVGIDRLKQILDDYRIGTSDAGAFDRLVTKMRNSAKDLIKGEPGYSEMVGGYERSTGLIKDIERSLSLTDKASRDTAWRKLSTVLKENNEIRQKLVQELDEISGGTLIPKIAGSQFSTFIPRGLSSRLEATAVGVGGGVASIPILPIVTALAAFSPRVVGELARFLNLGARGAQTLKNILIPVGSDLFPGDVVASKVSNFGRPKALASAVDNELAPMATASHDVPMKEPEFVSAFRTERRGKFVPKFPSDIVSPNDIRRAADLLAEADMEIWDKLGVQSGGQLMNPKNGALLNKYYNELAKLLAPDGRFRNLNGKVPESVIDMLEMENHHTLVEFLAERSKNAPKVNLNENKPSSFGKSKTPKKIAGYDVTEKPFLGSNDTGKGGFIQLHNSEGKRVAQIEFQIRSDKTNGTRAVLPVVEVLDESLKGSGIGTKLVQEVERRAKAAGADRVIAQVVHAPGFFTKLGYVPSPHDSPSAMVKYLK